MNRRNEGMIFGNATAIILVIVSFAISWKVILPSYSENKQKQVNLESEVSAASEKLDSLKTAKTSLSNLGTIVDQLFVAIPKDKDMPNLITELEQIAAKHKTYIPSIQITDGSKDTTAGGSDDIVSISFSVNGSFEDMQGFLKSIENNLKFFNIQSLTIASGDSGAISLSLQINAYKQIDTSLLTGSIPTTLPTSSSTEGIQ